MAPSSAVASHPTSVSGNLRLAFGYSLMIGGMVVCYLLIRSHGETLTAPAAALIRTQAPAARSSAIGHVLLSLVTIIIMARLLGSAFRYFHQPPVIGEIIAGILLGPSFLGHLAPAVSTYVFPTSVGPFPGVISGVGVILYISWSDWSWIPACRGVVVTQR